MSIRRNPLGKPMRKPSMKNDFLNLEEKPFKEPDTWTIITALNRVLELARDSELSDEFWENCKNPLSFLNNELELTNVQIVVLAMLVDADDTLNWKEMGEYLGLSRLSMMVYADEIEKLEDKGWIDQKKVRAFGNTTEGFLLERGVVKALCKNKTFVPEKIDGLNEQQLIDKLESHVEKNMNDPQVDFEDDERWMMKMVAANPHLPLCHDVLQFNDIHVQTLLMMAVFDFAQWAGSEYEGMTMQFINRLYPEDCLCDFMRQRLSNGTHELIEKGYLEQHCEDGMANTEHFMLTKKAKEELLSAYNPRKTKCRPKSVNNRYLKSHTTIKEKPLFFNTSEEEQLQRLNSLLQPENLPSVQERLEEQGLRKGFACLFYGAPGTGKTESVLQIARQTGRDLMMVDIAGMRDKYVGETEKNMKEVFARYRQLCQQQEKAPILFFNEADALFNKRTENIEQAVDKMENAMQNIILQELENLDGILIATTNLTSNLDKAFERRFLFKIEFKKPETEVKAQIWQSMLKDITPEEAAQLAARFDFAGGQIENIARKRTIDYILSGKAATLEEIEGYCRNELLDDKKERRTIAGFGG